MITLPIANGYYWAQYGITGKWEVVRVADGDIYSTFATLRMLTPGQFAEIKPLQLTPPETIII